MNASGWSRGLEVSGGGQGVVSHAGLALLRHLADKTGLTGGLAQARCPLPPAPAMAAAPGDAHGRSASPVRRHIR